MGDKKEAQVTRKKGNPRPIARSLKSIPNTKGQAN